jgi:Domain of unknown function (DUF4157)
MPTQQVKERSRSAHSKAESKPATLAKPVTSSAPSAAVSWSGDRGASQDLDWNFGKAPVHSRGIQQPRSPVHRKLGIGAVNDPLEFEADAIADHVLNASPPRNTKPGSDAAAVSSQSIADGLRRKPVRAASPASATAEAPPIVHEALRSPGRPLDAPGRSFMETRLGHDFSGVRVHADATAIASARTVNALAYTVGRDIVFGAGQYQPSTPSGRRLLAHELAHVAQDANSPVIRRQPAPAATADLLALDPSADKSENNPRIAAFAASARKRLTESGTARIGVSVNYNSAAVVASSEPGDVVFDKQKQLRQTANSRGESVKAALVKLGIPAGSISVMSSDLNQDGAAQGPDGQVTLAVLGAIAVAPLPKVDVAAIPEPAQDAPLLDLDRDADLTPSNLRIAETVKHNLNSLLQSPGGTVKVFAYVGQDPGGDPKLWNQQHEWAQARSNTVRDALISLGVAAIDVDAAVKFVPMDDKQASHVTIAFKPKPKTAEAGVDLGKLTTFQFGGRGFSIAIKLPLPYFPVPKEIALKSKLVNATVSIPKGAGVTFKPIRGLPGVEIGASGEVKIADLIKPPTPVTTPGGFTEPQAGAPLKFTLYAAVNFKGYKIEANTVLDTAKRTETTGLYITLIESKVQYQAPSSVFDDIAKAGAQLQTAVNNLMGVADQQVSQAPVGQPPPPPPAPPGPSSASAALGNIANIIDAFSSILDAMDKIDKAKTAPAQFKVKVGPQVIAPYGPQRAPTAADPLGNRPSVGIGISGTF